VSTEGLAYWRPQFGTIFQTRPRDDYHFRSGFAAGTGFALFNSGGTPQQVGKFIPADFPFDWLRAEITQYKRLRPYYNSDYYPLLPCSSNAACTTSAASERSADFEWAAWQFNRPEQRDGIVQAFRRSGNEESTKTLLLRGLDPNRRYRVIGAEKELRSPILGRDLMQLGLRIEINEKPGAAVLFYEQAR
jgi:hypothetical protein